MTLILGCLLGCGILLLASPFLWPRGVARPRVRPSVFDVVRARLTQAGLESVPVGVFLTLSVIVAIIGAALCQVLLGVTAITAAAGVAGLMLPALLVMVKAQAKRQATRTVWPDVVDHLVSAVRSGLALPDSVSSLAHSGPPETRDAFAGFEREYRATGSFSHAIDTLKDALADPVADRILETLRMAREVGGSDLTMVLRSLAAWLRQDAAIRQEAEARQSWVVNAAKLGVAAPWIILVLLASRPEAALAYNSSSGLVVIIGGLAVSVVAYRVMIALGKLPEEKRWFQ
ncbi:type II secretion system F family protein [Leifsonia sp. A12D58]|uniref:type II secretion system F family protein n=1 Tax=Leifsonia sp. A12D58 TaxID=3397674 RepID=UPI0039DFA31E